MIKLKLLINSVSLILAEINYYNSEVETITFNIRVGLIKNNI